MVGGKYANWCRVRGHKSTCNCEYPAPSELIAMRGGKPGERPMPKKEAN